MAFCNECGAEVAAGIKFCSSCGNPMGQAAQPVPAMAAAQEYSPSQPQPVQSVYVPPAMQSPQPSAAQPRPASAAVPVPGSDAPPAKGSRYAVMGVGAYIGIMLLYSLPIVGIIACIIVTFAAKNQNLRNFSKAMLILLIVGIVISIAVSIFLGLFWEAVIESITASAGGVAGDIVGSSSASEAGGILDLLGMFGDLQ